MSEGQPRAGALEGKIALVTGASRGLGRAIALALAGAGAKVALVGRDLAKLEETAAEAAKLGAEFAVFQADISDEAQVAALEQEVAARFGRIDILINNAGITVRKLVVDLTLEEWRRVMDTNLTSVFLMCRAFIPHMRGRGYGRILNVASTLSHIGLPLRGAYAASKAGLLGLTRVLALELAADGITVVGISPGPFGTEMNTALMNDPETNARFMSIVPLARWGNVEEVGKLAVFLCSDGAGYITGTDIVIDGGWTAT
jgi:NAD(P)-dependent dehydrogenase (short-subunit alcohol dehydrogenase family)